MADSAAGGLSPPTGAAAATGASAGDLPETNVLNHRLLSDSGKSSEVERLATRIESKRGHRIPVTFSVRLRFLRTCRQIAKREGLAVKISLDELQAFRDDVQNEVDAQGETSSWFEYLGFRNEAKALLAVLQRGIDRVTNELVDNWLYFKDFSYYFTTLESRYPWNRTPLMTSAVTLFFFYLFTPIFFCLILSDEQVCPSDPGKPFAGWLTSLYFASTTMSTVGYGDVSVEKDDRWHVFIGILYMIVSMVVLVTAFSAAADHAYSPFTYVQEKILASVLAEPGSLLHHKLRRAFGVKISAIIVQFLILNMLGVFVARAFVNQSNIEKEQWTWMTTLYWSVQTTTTIGYGDLEMPFDMRWFQIFYLVISTFFVGGALGKIGSLQDELQGIRRYYAWERREVSKGMVEDMQAEGHDNNIDQYEFVVASLLELQKISSDDILPIMEKYRVLANLSTGFIDIDSIQDANHEEVTLEEEAAKDL